MVGSRRSIRGKNSWLKTDAPQQLGDPRISPKRVGHGNHFQLFMLKVS
jgi:hypothetical protein